MYNVHILVAQQAQAAVRLSGHTDSRCDDVIPEASPLGQKASASKLSLHCIARQGDQKFKILCEILR